MNTTLTMPHEAHVSFVTSPVLIDNYNTLCGYVTWCEDCEWSQSYLARDYPNMLTAWNEAVRARDIHHDTHTKETE